MNIKNKKGVTITVLVITVVIMLILFGITFSTSTELLKNSQRNKMKSMLYMVQSRAEILLDDYLFEIEGKTPDEKNSVASSTIQSILKGTYISNSNDLKSVGYTETGDLSTIKGTVIYCSWNESVLKSQGIDTKNLARGDTIVIKYDIAHSEVDVASTKGFSKDGVPIHSLKDF